MNEHRKTTDTQITITCPQCGGAGNVVRLDDFKQFKEVPCPSCHAMLSVGSHSVTVQGIDAAEVERVSRALLADVHASRRPPSPWLSGSFYLLAAVVVLAILLVVTRVVPLLVLPPVIIAAVIFLAVIGAFQLRHDERLTDKSFLSLMTLSFRALPWIRSATGSATKKPVERQNI